MPGSKEVNLAVRTRARKPCLVYILQSVCTCNAVFNTFPSSLSLSHQEVLVTRLIIVIICLKAEFKILSL